METASPQPMLILSYCSPMCLAQDMMMMTMMMDGDDDEEDLKRADKRRVSANSFIVALLV